MRVVVILSILLIGLAACKKKDIKKIEKAVTSGSWKITRFIDSGDDETSSYANATFTFTSGGSISMNNGSNSFTGSWSVTKKSKSDDDSDDSDFKFNIALPTPHESLSDDWHIESYSDSRINLRDLDDDEPNKSDYLTFEKI
ncbi:hypothetical protein [Fluviicola sp.]|uniref:hypothetical protein n=1 Tax=Fluviicola sp. TaxID=1917219 RepID=UPI00260A2335|nr:hypothetical protein [Fluviicola sp.]